MNKRLIILTAAMVSVVSFSSISCKQKEAVKGADSGQILAKINNTEITLSDFNERLKEYPTVAHGGNLDLETKKGFLDNLIVRELLYQEAIHKGLDKEKETADMLEEMKKRILVEKFFKKELEEDMKISDEELKKYYDEHPEEAKAPVEVRASHILLKTKEEAEGILKKLRAGAKFEDLAKSSSIDTGSKAMGGDLGYFHSGVMVPEFETAAFKLKKGEISDIVESRFGYHIIKITDRRTGKEKSFADAKTELEQNLLKKKKKEKFDNLVAGLKSKASITIKEDLLK
ncbi:MAG: peptidylprolyl isomerase [Nitrospirae bacterium]|nr:peptidylprolyl isomerase [Nitrospirota bacterium]